MIITSQLGTNSGITPHLCLMKKLFMLLLILCSFATNAQDKANPALDRALSEARKMAKAFLEKDFDTFISLNHPRIVEGMGGKEKMKALISRGFGPDAELLDHQVEAPKKLIVNGDTLQCAFKQAQYMNIQGTKYLIESWLIGISYDKGDHWSFIGVATRTLEELQAYFTELSDELGVKPQTNPQKIEN